MSIPNSNPNFSSHFQVQKHLEELLANSQNTSSAHTLEQILGLSSNNMNMTMNMPNEYSLNPSSNAHLHLPPHHNQLTNPPSESLSSAVLSRPSTAPPNIQGESGVEPSSFKRSASNAGFEHEIFDENDYEREYTAIPGAKKGTGRRKIRIEYIDDKSRRHITFSKRKAGIMKKAYELSTLTGTQVLLLVASETGHVYTFATPKLQPLITKPEGKNMIQECLDSTTDSNIVSGPGPRLGTPMHFSEIFPSAPPPSYNDAPSLSRPSTSSYNDPSASSYNDPSASSYNNAPPVTRSPPSLAIPVSQPQQQQQQQPQPQYSHGNGQRYPPNSYKYQQ